MIVEVHFYSEIACFVSHMILKLMMYRFNKNFKLAIQLFKDMFRHDSCHHQFSVLFRFPLF